MTSNDGSTNQPGNSGPTAAAGGRGQERRRTRALRERTRKKCGDRWRRAAPAAARAQRATTHAARTRFRIGAHRSWSQERGAAAAEHEPCRHRPLRARTRTSAYLPTSIMLAILLLIAVLASFGLGAHWKSYRPVAKQTQLLQPLCALAAAPRCARCPSPRPAAAARPCVRWTLARAHAPARAPPRSRTGRQPARSRTLAPLAGWPTRPRARRTWRSRS